MALPTIVIVVGVVVAFARAVAFYRALAARPCPLCSQGRLRWVASHKIDGPTGAAIDVVDTGTCGRCRGTVVQSHQHGWRGVHGTREALAGLQAGQTPLSWSTSERLWGLLDRRGAGIQRLCASPASVTARRGVGLVAGLACLALGIGMADKVQRVQALGNGVTVPSGIHPTMTVALEDRLADDPWHEVKLDEPHEYVPSSLPLEDPPFRQVEEIGLRLKLADRWSLSGAEENHQGRAAIFASNDPNRRGLIAVMVLKTPPGPGWTSERLTAALRGGMAGPEATGPRSTRNTDCGPSLRGIECLSVPTDPDAPAVAGWAWETHGSAIVMIVTMPNSRDIWPLVDEAYATAKSVEF